MLKTRILSALVLAPPALAAVWFGGWGFTLLIAVAAALMAWEWDRLCTGRFERGGVTIAVAAVLATMVGGGAPGLAVALLLFFGAVLWLDGRVSRHGALWWRSAGLFYVGLPAVALVWLRADGEAGRATLIWLFLVVWATDVGAYAAGRTIGGPLLAPRISPRKTWAGLGGGMASAALVGAGTALLLDLPLLWLAGFSGLLAVVAQAGDFGESWVKRHFGVKDSSAIIPGHGGVLDRVDGLLAAAPVAALVSWIYGGGVLAWR